MKADRVSGMNANDMMKNFEFMDHNECLLEMQILCSLFFVYLTDLWQADMGFNIISDVI